MVTIKQTEILFQEVPIIILIVIIVSPLSLGKSDPYTSQNDMYGARSQSPRKSWDGSYLKYVCP